MSAGCDTTSERDAARLTLTADGDVVVQRRRQWADGMTCQILAPTAILTRRAVPVPALI